MSSEAFDEARQLEHPFSLNYVNTIIAWMHTLQGNVKKTQKITKELIRSSTRYGFRLWQAFGKIFLGSTLSKHEQTEKGVSLIREGLAVMDQIDYTIDRPYVNSLLAEVLVRQKKYEEAILLMDTSLKKIEQTGDRWFEAEIYRLHGEIYLKTKPAKLEKQNRGFKKHWRLPEIKTLPVLKSAFWQAWKN